MAFSNLKRPDDFSEFAVTSGMLKNSCLIDILLFIFGCYVPVLC